MIGKVPFETEKITHNGKTMEIDTHASPYDLQCKINELVDAVNVLQNRSSNSLIKTLRMDKEFAEDECVRLQGKLETTQNALEQKD